MTAERIIALALTALLFAAGAVLFRQGHTTPYFTNEAEFQKRHRAIASPLSTDPSRDDISRIRHDDLLREYSTKSHVRENHGLSVMAIAVLVFTCLNWHIIAPHFLNRRVTIALFGIIAAGASPTSRICHYALDHERGLIAHWAKLEAGNVQGAFLLFCIFSAWAVLHASAACNKNYWHYHTNKFIDDHWPTDKFIADGWPLFLAGVTAFIILFHAAHGNFFSVISSSLWFLFYAFILFSRISRPPVPPPVRPSNPPPNPIINS